MALPLIDYDGLLAPIANAPVHQNYIRALRPMDCVKFRFGTDLVHLSEEKKKRNETKKINSHILNENRNPS